MDRLAAEVLVVGGGPAGAATAALLARRGHDVLVLEKAAFPREKPCGEYLSPGVADVLARLGTLERVEEAPHSRPVGMGIVTSKSRFLLQYPDPDAEGLQRAALGIPRPVFDQVLLDHARATGARVAERTVALGALVEDGRVVGVRTRGPAGEASPRSRFVVGADGLHSAIARSLGLDLPVAWPRRLGLVARYAGPRAVECTGAMHVGQGLYCGLAPVGKGLLTVGLVGAIGAKPSGEPVDRFFESRLRELPGVLDVLGDARRVTPVHGRGPLARRVRRVAGPGYLLVGDAAGFLDPFTGEGVYRALRGAELAAAAVERALESARAVPIGYARDRQAAFAAKERVCLLVQLFLSSHRLFDYVVKHLAERPNAAELLGGVLGDYRPATPALRPGFLWSLLRP